MTPLKNIVLCAVAVCASLLLSPHANAQSGTVNLSWTPPVLNEDETPLTDLTSYTISWNCDTPGAPYPNVDPFLAPASSRTITGLPSPDTCYFVIQAVNSVGVSSAFSNEGSKTFQPSGELPGPVENLNVTTSESVVAFTNQDAFYDTAGSGTTVTATPPGGAPSEGDLVVAFIHTDGTPTITDDGDAGTDWDEEYQQNVTSETARIALFSKIANDSEPTEYTWTLSFSEQWSVVLYVFSAASAPEVDSAVNFARTAGTDTDMIATAADGRTISDNALSLIFAGKDFRSGSGADHSAIDNSYVGLEGDAEFQNTAGAYRIYTTGETFSGDITITDAQQNTDFSYSLHMSFVESDAGALLVIADSTHVHTADALALTQANMLVVSDTVHSLTSDNTNLVQANVLAIADALHGHLADNVDLTQANTLAINDTLHGHLADNITLIAANALIIQDALHGHTADNVDLVQANVLAINDTLHGLASDNIALVVAGTLIVADALHSLASDNIDLLQANVLVIAEALHALASDNVDLTQANLLAIADTLHSLVSDNVVLSVGVQLDITDALHGHLADNVALTQANILAIQDTLHALLSDKVDLTQATTLIVDDTLHALFSDVINFGDIPVSKDSVLVVESRDRILIIAPRRTRLN